MEKHVFYIEGGDNVGKSTTIENLKKSKAIIDMDYIRFCFPKYPSNNITEEINEINKSLQDIEKLKHKTLNYRGIKNMYIEGLMKLMIGDMKETFSTDNDLPEFLNNLNVAYICDRGYLSTYLYQYRNHDGLENKENLTIEQEKALLELFLNVYVPYLPSDNSIIHNVIILYNNKNTILSNPTQETIEYKKQYDNDVALQTRINNSINNIVKLIDNNDIEISPKPINFYYIEIYDAEGNRKTPDQICSELVSIINKEDKSS